MSKVLLLAGAGHVLTCDNDGGGRRHYLDGRPVHCGTGLEMSIGGGLSRLGVPIPEIWVPVRYELCGDLAVLYTNFGKVLPNAETLLRWPS